MWALLSKAQSGRKKKEGDTMKFYEFIQNLKNTGLDSENINLIRHLLIAIKRQYFCKSDEEALEIFGDFVKLAKNGSIEFVLNWL